MPLHHPAAIETLCSRPRSSSWCVLPFFFRSVRRRNMMQRIYPCHAALGNPVGLHYRRFWPKLKTPPLANQVLSRLKNLKIRVFESESAKTGSREWRCDRKDLQNCRIFPFPRSCRKPESMNFLAVQRQAGS